MWLEKGKCKFLGNFSGKKKGEERNMFEGIFLIEKIVIGEDCFNLNLLLKRFSFLYNC